MSGFSRKSGSTALPQPSSSPSPTLSDFAQSMGNIGGAVGETQVVAKGRDLVTWLGEAAEAYSGESKDIQSSAIKLQRALATIKSELSSYGHSYQALVGTLIPDYQGQWDEAIELHDKNVEKTEGERKSAFEKAYPQGNIDESSFNAEVQKQGDDLKNTQDDLAKLYNKAVDELDDSATSAGKRIAGAIDGVVPRSKDGGTPSRSDVGVSLFGDNGGLLAAQTLMQKATDEAPEAAKLLMEQDKNGLPTEDALKKFNEKYGGQLQNNPFFAAAFYEQFSAEELNALLGSAYGRGQISYGSDGYRKELEASLSSLGAGLVLATGGSNGPSGSASSDVWKAWENIGKGEGLELSKDVPLNDWRSKFEEDLKRTGRLTWDYQGRQSEYGGISGYSAMAQIMRLAVVDNPELAIGESFLKGRDSVAHDIVKWSSEHPPTGNGNFDTLLVNSYPGATADPLQNMLKLINGAGKPGMDWLNSKTTFDVADPENDNSTGAPMNMTQYLVGCRPFGWEDQGEHWADKGETLGELLSEATGSDPDSKSSKEVAYNFIKGYTDGLGV